jgi:hypothetical protein
MHLGGTVLNQRVYIAWGNGCGTGCPLHGVATPGGFSNISDTATENNSIPSNNSLKGTSFPASRPQGVGDDGTVVYRPKK